MRRKISLSSGRPATKLDILRLEKATKADIARLAKTTKTDFARLEKATKTEVARLDNHLKNLATKEELNGVRNELISTNKGVSGLKGEVSGLKGEVSGLKGEVSGLKGEVINVKNGLTNTNKEVASLKSEMISLEIRLGMKIENKIQIVLEQMRENRMEILGAVANFGKRVSDLETGSNFTAARVVDHEARITHLETSR